MGSSKPTPRHGCGTDHAGVPPQGRPGDPQTLDRCGQRPLAYTLLDIFYQLGQAFDDPTAQDDQAGVQLIDDGGYPRGRLRI